MENPASRTALNTMALAAVETLFPPGKSLTRDELAASVLPLPWALFVRGMRVTAIRDAVLRAIERAHPGIWVGIACRKTYIDELLTTALAAGIGAVVNLGAGLDTRAYRLPGRERVPWFEVDLPENIAQAGMDRPHARRCALARDAGARRLRPRGSGRGARGTRHANRHTDVFYLGGRHPISARGRRAGDVRLFAWRSVGQPAGVHLRPP